MEKRLYWYICTPAALSSWVTGFLLSYYIGFEIWLFLKIIFVFILSIYHFVCGKWLKIFAENNNFHSEKLLHILKNRFLHPPLSCFPLVVWPGPA